MALTIKNKFGIDSIVYLKTDPEKLPRQITAIKITPAGLIYFLESGDTESEHYEISISAEKPVD